jgi:hypothetical protein
MDSDPDLIVVFGMKSPDAAPRRTASELIAMNPCGCPGVASYDLAESIAEFPGAEAFNSIHVEGFSVHGF